jgi:hypothetical protein
VIGGAVVGAATALIMNDRSRRSLAQSSINEQEDSHSNYLADITENTPDKRNGIESLFQPNNSTEKHKTNIQSLEKILSLPILG